MIHPIKSIISCQQGWAIKNYEKTKYSKRIKELKDTHCGERCFIVANGPSLTSDDLDTLHKNNE